MPALDPLYLTYVSATFALVITPGATTAVVVRHTLVAGWRGGLWAAAGAALGNSIWAAAAGLGLAVILTRAPRVFLALTLAGGCYLLWLAIKSAARLLGYEGLSTRPLMLDAGAPTHAHRAMREALSVNLLNPAIATFYLAVVPAFIPAAAPPGHYVGLAATHVIMACSVHVLWTVALDRLRPVFTRRPAQLALEGLTAGALGLLAARIFWTALR